MLFPVAEYVKRVFNPIEYRDHYIAPFMMAYIPGRVGGGGYFKAIVDIPCGLDRLKLGS